MLQIKGKYNQALIYIDNVEEECIKQLYNILNHPAFKGNQIRIMPDCHAGKGCVVGFTSTMNDYIIPNLIGVDIGCGMLSFNIGKKNINLEKFDEQLRIAIPTGTNIRDDEHRLVKETVLFKVRIETKATTVGCDIKRAFNSIGTLGGGNHFIELGLDPDKNIWITIHTGSRKLGESTCQYHQRKAKDYMNKVFIGDAYKDLEFLIDNDKHKYIIDMEFAQIYAAANRYAIKEEILNILDIHKDDVIETIESIHNYIDNADVGIVRKGATSAREGEKVIIPFNMRDGIAICTGKGNKNWNFSAPHGAGRILSRKKAKEQISLKEFSQSMDGIYSSSICESTIDESPMAYKDKDIILEAIKDTVDVNFLIKPIYNFKAL